MQKYVFYILKSTGVKKIFLNLKEIHMYSNQYRYENLKTLISLPEFILHTDLFDTVDFRNHTVQFIMNVVFGSKRCFRLPDTRSKKIV